VRVGDHYRALARRKGELIIWFWIGTHEEYNNSCGNCVNARLQNGITGRGYKYVLESRALSDEPSSA
jgi:hypothetical protein